MTDYARYNRLYRTHCERQKTIRTEIHARDSTGVSRERLEECADCKRFTPLAGRMQGDIPEADPVVLPVPRIPFALDVQVPATPTDERFSIWTETHAQNRIVGPMPKLSYVVNVRVSVDILPQAKAWGFFTAVPATLSCWLGRSPPRRYDLDCGMCDLGRVTRERLSYLSLTLTLRRGRHPALVKVRHRA